MMTWRKYLAICPCTLRPRAKRLLLTTETVTTHVAMRVSDLFQQSGIENANVFLENRKGETRKQNGEGLIIGARTTCLQNTP
jgi:hypothetical protein